MKTFIERPDALSKIVFTIFNRHLESLISSSMVFAFKNSGGAAHEAHRALNTFRIERH
jgi:hypothetical protein